MYAFKWMIALGVAFSISCPTYADESRLTTLKAIAEDIDAEIAAGRLTGIAAAVVKDGRIVWEGGFGYADRAAGRKATRHTAFSIASTTKPFTTTAMMTLVAAGKLHLDRPANNYLGDEKIVDDYGPVAAATVRMLASHTSGLPTYFAMYPEGHGKPSAPELVRAYGHVIAPPGERYEYSNLALTTLAYIVERQSGQAFEHYLAEHIFEPLGMRDSFYGTNLRRTLVGAVRYDTDGQALPSYLTGSPGSGEVYASAHDLALFAMLHLKNAVPGGKTILAPTQIDELHKPLVATGSPDESYGMGWQMWRPGGHTAALYHPGGQVGVSSEFLLLPDHNAAVILLSNRKTGRAFLTRTRDRLLRTVVPNWNGLPTSVPAPVRPAWPPKSYGGVWRGKLFVPGGSLWAALTVAADATSAQFAVGDTGGRPLKDFGLSDGLISGHVTLPIPAADELRFDVREVEISLKLRGNQMDGEAVAYKLTSKQMTILPHRLVLRREP